MGFPPIKAALPLSSTDTGQRTAQRQLSLLLVQLHKCHGITRVSVNPSIITTAVVMRFGPSVCVVYTSCILVSLATGGSNVREERAKEMIDWATSDGAKIAFDVKRDESDEGGIVAFARHTIEEGEVTSLVHSRVNSLDLGNLRIPSKTSDHILWVGGV